MRDSTKEKDLGNWNAHIWKLALNCTFGSNSNKVHCNKFITRFVEAQYSIRCVRFFFSKDVTLRKLDDQALKKEATIEARSVRTLRGSEQQLRPEHAKNSACGGHAVTSRGKGAFVGAQMIKLRHKESNKPLVAKLVANFTSLIKSVSSEPGNDTDVMRQGT